QAAQQEVKAREAEVLREAYLFLAGAGPDDAGHRAKAMRQVHQAVEILDKRILKNGTQGQKVVALQEGSVRPAPRSSRSTPPRFTTPRHCRTCGCARPAPCWPTSAARWRRTSKGRSCVTWTRP